MRTRAYIILAVSILFIMGTSSQAAVSVEGDLTHVKSAQPGETYEGFIVVRNSSGNPQEIKVYQTDYLFFSDGRNEYGEPGKTPRSNSGWITFGPKRTIIPGKDSTKINYKVKVPEDVQARGTFWSMMMVEGVSEQSPESSLGKNKHQLGIEAILRYGIQIVTDIGDTGTSELKFRDSKLLKDKGAILLQVDLKNTGERWLKPSLWVDLYNDEGKSVGKFKGSKMRIYPGTSVRYKVDLGSIPRGKYKALTVADCGGDNVFGGVYVLKLEK